MTGDAKDTRVDTAWVLARLLITDRHLRRLCDRDFPSPHYLGERRRWWISEIVAWEATHTSRERPAAVSRGAGNLAGRPERAA